MKKLLLIAVLILSLSLIVGVALAQEEELRELVVPEAEAKEGDIIEVRALSEAKPSDFIALGTSVKRVLEDFQDEFRNSWGLEAGELDLEEGRILIVKGVHIPMLLAPVKGDKIQFFGYLPENQLTSGREAMGMILEIVEGRKMTIKIESNEYEMDLETGKVKVAEGQIQRGGRYWKCVGQCIADKAPPCGPICLSICVVDPTKMSCIGCIACGGAIATYCAVKCAF